jgi:hypothetical protein
VDIAMRRILSLAVAVVASLAIAGTALAAITFHSGPTVTFSGNTATATFNVSGLGNDPAQATLDISGTETFGCVNHGNNPAPGHPQTVDADGSTTAPLTKSEKNGRSTVTVTATLSATPPTASDLGCPNANWGVRLISASVITATLTIEQPIGTIIYGPATFTNQ